MKTHDASSWIKPEQTGTDLDQTGNTPEITQNVFVEVTISHVNFWVTIVHKYILKYFVIFEQN